MEVDEYRAQLREIEQALLEAPDRSELKEVRTELLELIEILAPQNQPQEEPKDSKEPKDPNDLKDPKQPKHPKELKEESKQIEQTQAQSEKQIESAREKSQLEAPAQRIPQPPPPAPPAPTEFPVGTHVLALKDSQYAPAKVIAVSGNKQYTVKFDKSTSTLPLSSLRPRPAKPPPKPKQDLLEQSKAKWQTFQSKRTKRTKPAAGNSAKRPALG